MHASSLRAAWRRVRESLSPSTAASDLEEEFRLHIEMETAENVRRGMSGADARRAAILRFGGAQRFREEARDARRAVPLDNLARDVRFAVRRIHRAPTFAAGVIATLGVGIGVAVGIGAIVWGVLLSPLPYHDSDRLVRVGFHTEGAGTAGDLHPAATYFHFATSARSFTELGAYSTTDGVDVTDDDAPARITSASVTPNVLTLLGARPIMGTLLETADTSWSNPRTAILISENLWRQRYGADPSIIGRRIDINRGTRTVVGVLPRTFDFPSPSVDIWYPLPTPVRRPEIVYRGLGVIGRLAAGIDAERAQAELNSLIPLLPERFPAITPDMLQRSRARASVTSLRTATVAGIRPQLVLLGVLVAVVLLIATTNVVNLFLLRTERASQEIAIALSLGASRAALAQRFVVEGVVLGLASTIVALPAAALAVSTKFGFTEREIPRLHEVTFGAATVAIVLGCAIVIGAAVGLTALTRTSVAGLFDRLRASRSTPNPAWRRAQDGLVSLQVAIALTLLIAAGLLGRSFWNLRSANIGFDAESAMTAQVSLPYGPTGYGSYAEHAAFHARMTDQLGRQPGVTGAAAVRYLPLTNRGTVGSGIDLQADDGSGRAPVTPAGNLASASYFRVMGIPLRAGRTFRAGDLQGAPAAIVSERLATSLFGTTAVVGRRVNRVRDGGVIAAFTIVGVVGDVHGERIEDAYLPMIYFPLLRDGDGLPADARPVPMDARDVQYVIRGSPLPAMPTIQRIAKDVDRRVPPANVRTLGSLVDAATARVRLTMLLVAVAGGAALLLGVIGVYSVVSYGAGARIREFGIRLAVGASPRRVASIVLNDGVRLVAIGTAIGLVAAVTATRFLRTLLYEVEPTSLVEFAVATAALLATSLVAAAIPARRAARTDPAIVLRGE